MARRLRDAHECGDRDRTTSVAPLQNHLLAALPVEVQGRLFPHLELISLPLGEAAVIGVSHFMGGETTPSRAVVQSAGHDCRLEGSLLKDEFVRGSPMQHLLLRYTQAPITRMAQTAVCNRHHSLDQQLCRWLVLSLDRLPGKVLVMTRGLIANMVGVRREGVTEAAGKLQEARLIRYTRGRIEVLNRPGIEARTCECCAVVKRECDRLLLPRPAH